MVTFNVDSLDFEDDEEARFGSNTDYAVRFDSANSRLELADVTNGTTAYVPQDVGRNLVEGKYAQTVAEGKALADDGDVYDSIQTAVNNASSYVKVGPGEFREYITIDTTGLTLKGSGNRTIIDVGTQDSAIRINANNVTVRDIVVNGGSGYGIRNFNTKFTSIQNVTVKNTDLYGIAAGPDGNVINCRVENCPKGYVLTRNSLVHSSYAKQSFNSTEDEIVVSSVNSAKFINNLVICSPNGRYGFKPQGDKNTMIVGNRFKGNGVGRGINTIGSDDLLIANNHFSGFTDYAIATFNSGNVLQDGNKIV